MSKIDYKLKSMVMSLDIDDIPIVNLVNKANRALNLPNSPFSISEKQAMEIITEIEETHGKGILKECQRINKSFYLRRQRLLKRVTFMVTHYKCLFLTMTFTDDILNNTCTDSRRQYIRRFLQQNFKCLYIANIDFGSHNEYIDRHGNKRVGTDREHYHAIIAKDRINLDLYPYGHIYYEKVRNNVKDMERLSTYINKLTNHAIKETTKRSCVIYSKSKEWKFEEIK